MIRHTKYTQWLKKIFKKVHKMGNNYSLIYDSIYVYLIYPTPQM